MGSAVVWQIHTTLIGNAVKQSRLLLSIALVFASAAAQADTLACVAPVFPAYSTSNHEIRRVAREVKHFRACQDAAAPSGDVVQINRQTAQVEAGLEAWLASTIDYSQGQRAAQRRLSFVDIDRVERGRAPRSEPRPIRRVRPPVKSDQGSTS